MNYATIDPTSGALVESFSTASDSELRDALDRSESAFAAWRVVPLAERAAVLSRCADLLEDQAPSLAGLMALEMGKPVAEGEGEARKCAWVCRYYADKGASFLEPEARESDGAEAYLRFEALGPILAIMPWNFPFWQFFRFVAPALVAGNVALLKHAPNTPGCAQRIETLLLQAGLPAGAVQNLFLTNEQAAEVIADRRVRGVTLTGSTRAGKQVAARAGEYLKTMVMELGGSDPFIVLDDADIDLAVAAAVVSRCLNNGQSCIAAKRFLIQSAVFDRFRDGLVEGMRARPMGDPRDPAVQQGPMARRDLRDELAGQVERSLAAGARALCGGEVPDREGFFYPATVLVDPQPGSPSWSEEMFGPVATLFRVEHEDEAIAVANASDYGLGASLWTADRRRAERLIPHIDSGSVFVNGFVKSDPRLPFGGIKDSGFGRELAREGLLEFVNRKTVWIA